MDGIQTHRDKPIELKDESVEEQDEEIESEYLDLGKIPFGKHGVIRKKNSKSKRPSSPYVKVFLLIELKEGEKDVPLKFAAIKERRKKMIDIILENN